MEELHTLEEDIKATQQAEEQAMVNNNIHTLSTIITTIQSGHLQTSSKNDNRKFDITEAKVGHHKCLVLTFKMLTFQIS